MRTVNSSHSFGRAKMFLKLNLESTLGNFPEALAYPCCFKLKCVQQCRTRSAKACDCSQTRAQSNDTKNMHESTLIRTDNSYSSVSLRIPMPINVAKCKKTACALLRVAGLSLPRPTQPHSSIAARVEPRRVSRIGILTYFIFGNLESFARFAVQYGAYPFSSMPTNSCLIAIHMKPLST